MSDKIESRRIVLGITGSVACYKSIELARLLISRGYEVRVVLTDSAKKFITPALVEATVGRGVITDFWAPAQDSDGIEHIEVADWADVIVISPATADFIAKLRLGIAESPLLATCLATKAPILIAPAMNVNMLQHVSTQEHISLLEKRGVSFVDPAEGVLACGWTGSGRLADAKEIFYHIRRKLSSQDLKGKKVLITTGPTREQIDPVRFISNRSSGKMGIALAREAFCRGAEVTLVHGPCFIEVPYPVRCVPVVTAQEMHDAVMHEVFEGNNRPDIVIMAAAVADFRPEIQSDHKLKRDAGETPSSLKVVPNIDILASVGKKRSKAGSSPILVGFAVETGDLDALLSELRRKLQTKNTDMMVGNFASEAFELDTNRVWIVDRNGQTGEVTTTFKSRIANKVLDAVLRL